MPYLSNGILSEEYEASKLDVPGPNFITQGVSVRRDMVYTLQGRRSLQNSVTYSMTYFLSNQI